MITDMDVPAVARRMCKPIGMDNHAARTCFHESCHVVADVSMGYEPDVVEYLGTDSSVAGRTHCKVGDPFDASCTLLAGPIGEMYALGRDPSDGVFFHGFESDFEKIRALIEGRRGRKITGDLRATAEFQSSFRRANGLIRKYWLAVEDLAEQLFVYRKLFRSDISRIVSPFIAR